MVLKVPRLNASPLALCDRPFSLLGFGDILVPGMMLVGQEIRNCQAKPPVEVHLWEWGALQSVVPRLGTGRDLGSGKPPGWISPCLTLGEVQAPSWELALLGLGQTGL
jgi:hypothetical protein